MHPPLPNINHHLLQRIIAGDETAFKELILQYTPSIASVVFSITRSKEQTEEVVQDIFIQLWTIRDNLTAIENLNGFLFVLTKRYAISAIRKMIRERNRVQAFAEIQYQQEKTEERDGYISLIDEAVNQLPPQQQRAWRLSRQEGRKYEEIATEMNISRETVKSYIQLANTAIVKYVKPRIHLILLSLFSHL
ncbi:RNA polymerase sigma factor [Pseudobacter ginsenosidimutans]|uniref:RNA polymerase sigma-70 factor (ECF subfamily) n=1 Tax=Pseudobacter ginsenosidimutans TaxID=661488 RepID=A0A4V2F0R1_9BACT|nr:sigma-70 family RNA polymerase sigma factor [Pseudobacter ginsenosidimutans]QEC42149.1 sigma-70 family RNA polymerase sigma factor [Pseudobacter ginsenosidimutans]RZS71011.1 RNA polymerase sigma-70 factor (ECF subfamily) [Pseudobacter ginsenosidimutans]